MTDSERTLDELAAQPVDAVDIATLRALRDAYESTDPVPDDLVARVHFAVALDEMFEEVAAISRVRPDALATRGEPTATRTETLTFSADRLTAMVTVTRLGSGRLRLDGWLAPPAPMRVSLRHGDGRTQEVAADEQGRFSFSELDEGFAQLRFSTADGDAAAASGASEEGGDGSVVTPVFEL